MDRADSTGIVPPLVSREAVARLALMSGPVGAIDCAGVVADALMMDDEPLEWRTVAMRAISCAMTLILAWSAASAVAAETEPNDATLGKEPPEGAVVLFNGKDLEGWLKADGKSPAAWVAANDVMTVEKGAGSIRTQKTFGDFQLHLEFNVPYMPQAKGQARGNSGVYLAGIHELQVLDSYGLKPQDNECGGIYKQVIPKVNACKPPLQWQTYDITFHKARVNDGKVEKKARVTVVQNGLTIIDEAEITPTPGGIGGIKEGEDGPLMLQDHGNAVQFRNIWLKPLDQ
jgi:hypothetical protein